MLDKELNMDTVLSPAYCEIWENSLLGVMVLDKNGIFRLYERVGRPNILSCFVVGGPRLE